MSRDMNIFAQMLFHHRRLSDQYTMKSVVAANQITCVPACIASSSTTVGAAMGSSPSLFD